MAPLARGFSIVATYVIEKDWTLLHASPGYEPFEQHFD
jgi:hypothetical protein